MLLVAYVVLIVVMVDSMDMLTPVKASGYSTFWEIDMLLPCEQMDETVKQPWLLLLISEPSAC